MIQYIDPQPLWQDISVKADQILLKAATPVTLTFDYLGTTYTAHIPVGWVTDMGSVPAAVRNIIPNTGAVDIAYILHDWLFTANNDLINITFDDANTILWLKLKERGLGAIKANLVYYSVKFFSRSHWRT